MSVYSRHSALSDKSAILHSDFRLRTSSARPQSSLENPDLSSQILECQDFKVAESRATTANKVTPAPKSAQSKQSNTAKQSFFRKQGEAAVSLVNTRIVGGEILDSKVNSESTLSDSMAVSESHPHTNLESPADSKLSAVEDSSTAIESIARSANLKGVVGAGGSSRGEGASLLNLQVWISPAASSSPSPLDKKESKIDEVLESKEVKAKDSKKLDLETKNQAESKMEGYSKKLDSSKSKSHTDSSSISESNLKVSKTLSESTPSVIASPSNARAKQSIEKTNAMVSKLDSKKLDCHDFAFTKSHNDDKVEYSEKLDLESKRLAESAMLADSEKLESSKARGFQKVKAKDSKKQSLESRQDSQTQKARGAETQKIDLESKSLDCRDFAFTKSRNDDKAEDSEKQSLESKRLAESAMVLDSEKLESKHALESRSLQILKSPLDSKTPPLQSLPHKLKNSTKQDTPLQFTGVALLLCGLLRDFGTGAITIGKHPKTSQIPQRQLGILRFLKKLRGACFAMINRGFQARSYLSGNNKACKRRIADLSRKAEC